MTLTGADKRRVAAAATFRAVLRLGWRLVVIAVIALLALPSGSTTHSARMLDAQGDVALLIEESRSIEFNATEIAGDGLDLGNWSILGGLSETLFIDGA